jgi:hypothetical protein
MQELFGICESDWILKGTRSTVLEALGQKAFASRAGPIPPGRCARLKRYAAGMVRR